MSCLFRIVFSHDLADHGFEAIDVLVGFDSAEVQMQLLLRALTSILTNASLASPDVAQEDRDDEEDDDMDDDDDDRCYPPQLKTLVLQLLLVITTVSQLCFRCI